MGLAELHVDVVSAGVAYQVGLFELCARCPISRVAVYGMTRLGVPVALRLMAHGRAIYALTSTLGLVQKAADMRW